MIFQINIVKLIDKKKLKNYYKDIKQICNEKNPNEFEYVKLICLRENS